jgi:YVTN family beta-propeller protein
VRRGVHTLTSPWFHLRAPVGPLMKIAKRCIVLSGSLCVALSSCSDSSGPEQVGPPADIDIVSGTPQSGIVGEPLPEPVVVHVSDAGGRSVAGARVLFRPLEQTAAITPAIAITNGSGEASAIWRLGHVVAQNARLRAVLMDSLGAPLDSVTFAATPLASAPARIVPGAITSLDLAPGERVHNFLRAYVADAYGNPVRGLSVQWSVSGASATLGADATSTDSEGLATNTITAGSQGAEGTVTARAGELELAFPFRILQTAATVVAPGGEPYGIALTATGVALATNLQLAVLHQFSPVSGLLPGGVTLGGTPVNVAVDPAGAYAYVANMALPSMGLQVVDIGADALVATIPIPGAGHAVSLSPDGGRVLVTSAESNVWILDAATRAIEDTILVTGGPWGLAFRTIGADTLVYVSLRNGGAVIEADVRTGVILRTFSVGGRPHGIALSPDGTDLWVANESLNTVQRIALSSGAVSSPIPLGRAFDVVLAPDGKTLFATSASGLALVVDVPTLGRLRLYGSVGAAGRLVANPDNITALMAVSSGKVVKISR